MASNVRLRRFLFGDSQRGIHGRRAGIFVVSSVQSLQRCTDVGNVPSMSRSRWVWLTAAALLVAAGTAGSLLGSSVVAHDDGERSHQTLDSSSMAISSTLKLAIQQENNLVISAKAFVVSNPNASNSNF